MHEPRPGQGHMPAAQLARLTMAGNISDSELFRKLQSLGVDVGPINDSTRAIYLRKYASLTSQSATEANKTSQDQLPVHPTTSPSQCSKQSNQDQPAKHRTPPLPTTPPATPPAIPQTTDTCTDDGEAVVARLVLSFDNPSHIASDTAFLFPDGDVLLTSRSILATQCSKMIPILYTNEAPYFVRVVTLSGQAFELMARGGELVMDLKEKISLLHGTLPAEQRLVFMDQELEDSRPLNGYGIFGGATLHLVLVASGMSSVSPSHSCPGMSPTLSISHFTTGLSQEQLSYFSHVTPPPSPAQRIPLPAHLAHVVHVHDRVYRGFKLFLRYLYTRKFQGTESEWSDYLLCYVLGELFQVPCLVQASLSAITTCLTEKLAHALLQFSKSIQSPPLERVCITYIQGQPST